MRAFLKIALVLAAGLIQAEPLAIAQPPGPKPPSGTYKVAFWYETDHPTTTLKYQVYDLSRGEYDEKAVTHWVRGILDHDQAHGAYVRDIRTEGLPGATEPERLARAIALEKERWAALQRTISAPVPRVVDPTVLTTRTSHYGPPRGMVSSPGAPGSPGGPGNPGVITNLPSSPFPYPYRAGPR